jgi:hypothetical protein
MTNTRFPTRSEGYAMPRWISASVAVGALMATMIGILTVMSGTAVPSEPAVFTTAGDHDNPVARSGTLLAEPIVY